MKIMNSCELPEREPWFGRPNANLTVGIVSPCYSLEKVSYALKPGGVDFYKVRSLPLGRLPSRSNFYENTPFVFPARTDLLHTFNKIPINGPPFVVSFELEFPRYFGKVSGGQHRIARNILRSDRCRAILGLSEIAVRLAKEQFSLEGENAISDKISVFRGGFYEGMTEKRRRGDNEPIRLLFVGNDYLRKGLVAAGMAVIELLKSGLDVEFKIISNLDSESYVARPDEKTEALLAELRCRPQVKFLGAKPYAEVMTCMAQADFLLLPTLDESLGWGPIEAAMNETPTVTTNIFAIPEFVRAGETGEILSLPVDLSASRWVGVGRYDQDLFWDAQILLAEQLVNKLQSYGGRKEIIDKLGSAAKKAAIQMYSVDRAKAHLLQIYQAGL